MHVYLPKSKPEDMMIIKPYLVFVCMIIILKRGPMTVIQFCREFVYDIVAELSWQSGTMGYTDMSHSGWSDVILFTHIRQLIGIDYLSSRMYRPTENKHVLLVKI